MSFFPYFVCALLGVDSLRGGLAVGNRISETDFFDILTIQNDQISNVKHVLAPLYVFCIGTQGALSLEHGAPSCPRCRSLGWGIIQCCRAGHEGHNDPSAGPRCRGSRPRSRQAARCSFPRTGAQ